MKSIRCAILIVVATLTVLAVSVRADDRLPVEVVAGDHLRQ
jgi:hypothetical protein